MNLHSLAFIALGSNLGTSETSVRRAMDQLEQFSAKPLLRSSLWQTTPLDCPPDSPRFVNAVAGLTPRHEESPESLLKKLQEMEIEAGRPAKRAKNAPRPLDLDLLTFADEIRNTAQLVLPHSRAQQRRFVLQPLAEIAPEFTFPGARKTISELLAHLPLDPALIRLE